MTQREWRKVIIRNELLSNLFSCIKLFLDKDYAPTLFNEQLSHEGHRLCLVYPKVHVECTICIKLPNLFVDLEKESSTHMILLQSNLHRKRKSFSIWNLYLLKGFK